MEWLSRGVMGTMSMLSQATRCKAMGFATGTRGDNVRYCAEHRPNQVAITIDDAPSRCADMFEQLLDLLQKENVHVSFQVISGHASTARHMDLMRRAVEAGHQLVNHSCLDRPCLSMSEEEFERDLDECQALIDELQPKRTLWFRPPSGKMNDTMRRVTRRKGYMVALGDCYSNDPHVADPAWHVRTLTYMVEPGSIVIVHCPEENSRAQTLEVMPELIRALRDEKGMELATLDEMFGDDPPPLKAYAKLAEKTASKAEAKAAKEAAKAEAKAAKEAAKAAKQEAKRAKKTDQLVCGNSDTVETNRDPELFFSTESPSFRWDPELAAMELGGSSEGSSHCMPDNITLPAQQEVHL